MAIRVPATTFHEVDTSPTQIDPNCSTVDKGPTVEGRKNHILRAICRVDLVLPLAPDEQLTLERLAFSPGND